jgi:hypothetical protein
VSLVPDQDHLAAVAGKSRHFHVHLGHERAGRVEDPQAALLRLGLNGLRHAVGAEDHRGVGRHLVEIVDEHGAESAQPLHHEAVVNDLVAHVDRGTEQLERSLDDLDGTIHAGAEAARVREQDLHLCSRNASRISSPAPIVMALSAMLNAGK